MSNDDRLAELILYVANRAQDDETFGKTKLNKILFYADFLYFGKHGRPITGQEYMREKNGPVPRRMLPVSERMREEGELAYKVRQVYNREQHRPVALRDADVSGFAGDEIAMVEYVISQFRGKTATEVSELSHTFEGWKLAEDKETIPYETIYLSERPLTESEYEFARRFA